jgi:hypothetical protein
LDLPVQFLSTNPNVSEETKTTGSVGFGRSYLFVTSRQPPLGPRADTSTVPFKVDLATGQVSRWGIASPGTNPATLQRPTVVKAPPASRIISPFDSLTGWQAAGALAEPLVLDTRTVAPSGSSIRLSCQAKNQVGMFRRLDNGTGGPLDLTSHDGDQPSVEADYIEFWVHINKPQHVTALGVYFFLGTDPNTFVNTNFADFATDFTGGTASSGAFKNYLFAEIPIKVVRNKAQIRQLKALHDLVPFRRFHDRKKMREWLKRHPNTEPTPDLSFQQFTAEHALEVVSNTWTRVQIPRTIGLFFKLTGDPSLGWSNVIGMGVAFQTNERGAASVWWGKMKLSGGFGQKGDYLYTWTYRNDSTGARSNPPLDLTGDVQSNPNYGQIQTVSVSAVDRQIVQLQFPQPLTGVDPQVTHLELWRNIGNSGLTDFFLVAKIPMTVDANGNGTLAGGGVITDSVADYVGMYGGGGTNQPVLHPHEELTVDNAPPPPTLSQAVYHPPSGRVFALDAAAPQRVLYSPPGRPESLGNAGFLDISSPGDACQALVVWQDTVWVFTQRGIFGIQGTDVPFYVQPVPGAVGTSAPLAIVPTPVGIVYQGTDTLRLFDGMRTQTIEQLALITRGSALPGIPSFRALVGTFGRNTVYLSDGLTTTYAWDLDTNAWRNVGLPATLLYGEPDQPIVLLGNAPLPVGTPGVPSLPPTGVLRIVTGVWTLSSAPLTASQRFGVVHGRLVDTSFTRTATTIGLPGSTNRVGQLPDNTLILEGTFVKAIGANLVFNDATKAVVELMRFTSGDPAPTAIAGFVLTSPGVPFVSTQVFTTSQLAIEPGTQLAWRVTFTNPGPNAMLTVNHLQVWYETPATETLRVL